LPAKYQDKEGFELFLYKLKNISDLFHPILILNCPGKSCIVDCVRFVARAAQGKAPGRAARIAWRLWVSGMDDIIQKIIDSEKMAQTVIKEARDERQHHENKMRADIEAYRKKVSDETQLDIERFLKAQREETDAALKAIDDTLKARIAKFRQSASRHKDEWVGYLFDKILDGGIG
jgi:vacuolar-type H+-ATPase subunit H